MPKTRTALVLVCIQHFIHGTRIQHFIHAEDLENMKILSGADISLRFFRAGGEERSPSPRRGRRLRSSRLRSSPRGESMRESCFVLCPRAYCVVARVLECPRAYVVVARVLECPRAYVVVSKVLECPRAYVVVARVLERQRAYVVVARVLECP